MTTRKEAGLGEAIAHLLGIIHVDMLDREGDPSAPDRIRSYVRAVRILRAAENEPGRGGR